MKLFIVAALICAVSAARLEQLERGYLPPSQNNYGANAGVNSFPTAAAHGSFGLSGQGSQYIPPNRGSNGFGSFGRSNDYVSNGVKSNGFGGNGVGSNGFGNNGNYGSKGFGANGGRGSNGQGGNGAGSSNYVSNGFSGRNGGSSAATSNQYLPPNYGAPASNGGSSFGSSIKPACSTCGSSGFGSPQRYQQQGNNYGSQGLSIPSTQYGSPQSLIPSSSFESQPSYTAQQDELAGASRQYLTPKASSAQSVPQQPFDENTGYIY